MEKKVAKITNGVSCIRCHYSWILTEKIDSQDCPHCVKMAKRKIETMKQEELRRTQLQLIA